MSVDLDNPPPGWHIVVEQLERAREEARLWKRRALDAEESISFMRDRYSEAETAGAIAAFCEAKSYCKDRYGNEYRNGDLIDIAADIRAHVWKKP